MVYLFNLHYLFSCDEAGLVQELHLQAYQSEIYFIAYYPHFNKQNYLEKSDCMILISAVRHILLDLSYFLFFW